MVKEDLCRSLFQESNTKYAYIYKIQFCWLMKRQIQFFLGQITDFTFYCTSENIFANEVCSTHNVLYSISIVRTIAPIQYNQIDLNNKID